MLAVSAVAWLTVGVLLLGKGRSHMDSSVLAVGMRATHGAPGAVPLGMTLPLPSWGMGDVTVCERRKSYMAYSM